MSLKYPPSLSDIAHLFFAPLRDYNFSHSFMRTRFFKIKETCVKNNIPPFKQSVFGRHFRTSKKITR